MSTRKDTEDGIRVGLGIAIKALEEAAVIGSQAQKDALLGVADGLRELSAGFEL